MWMFTLVFFKQKVKCNLMGPIIKMVVCVCTRCVKEYTNKDEKIDRLLVLCTGELSFLLFEFLDESFSPYLWF